MMKKLAMPMLPLLLFVGTAIGASGQQAITILGGDVSNTKGTLSYSAGEVAVLHSQARAITVVNITSYFTEGVQQAFVGTVNDIVSPLPYAVNVYPNPTSDRVVVSLPDEASSHALHFTLYDLQGHTLQSLTADGFSTEIDLTSLPAGTYMLHINNTENQTQSNVYKIIKAQ
jgi:hypothetical protein